MLLIKINYPNMVTGNSQEATGNRQWAKNNNNCPLSIVNCPLLTPNIFLLHIHNNFRLGCDRLFVVKSHHNYHPLDMKPPRYSN